ncbi:MAG: SulP family inorganic anion transporter [Deltaproteobacteria bacterium]|nr:SulP family inorganic anion transporter [Deltaproteobacteria bacterium]
MLAKIFPFILWFKDYNFNKFKIDFLAGLTVALVLIPQSMAYAQLAGLPAYYGLYASFLPPMMAALFGSSRQLATGPVAVVSLMTAASLEPLATAGSEAFIAYAILLSLTVGIFQFLLGVLRLGLVVNFLSHPVVNGFTNAAAIIIASSQLSKLFGVYVDKAEHHYETIIRVINAAISYTHWPSLLMGIFAIAIMYSLKRLNPKIPNVLVAVVITTLISWSIGFEHNHPGTSISAIQAPEVQTTIKNFNKTVAEISETGNQRAEINKKIEDLKASEDHFFKLLNLKHEVSILTARMSEQKHQSHVLRERLRNIKFAGIEGPDKALVFYPQNSVPQGLVTDGQIWRMKVGNKVLTEEDLLMIGAGAVVGNVPKGLPTLSIPPLNISVFFKLFPYAVIIALLGFMEAISIAKAMAAKTGQKLDPNQELIGQGIANILGAIGKSYPSSGSFSRSAVNLQAGAVSGISSVVTSLVVVIALLFFTPLLYHLPQAVLASVIMMAVIGLINISGFIHAWKAQWYDGAITIITFISTLAFAPHLDKGIMVGVALSLLVFLYKSMRPKVLSLSMSPDLSLRCAEEFTLKECGHIAVIRFDGPLFFANASYLEDRVSEIISKKPDLKHIILAANGINDMDASGEEALSLLVERVRSGGYGFSLSHVKENVMAVMKRTHLLEKIGKENVYPTQDMAVKDIYYKTHTGTEEDEKSCPLLSHIPATNE